MERLPTTIDEKPAMVTHLDTVGTAPPDTLLVNPLAGLGRAALEQRGRAFVEEHNLGEQYAELFQRAAVLAQDPKSFQDPSSEFQTDPRRNAERDALERELKHKWDQPRTLYALVAVCSLGAVVQGWNETAANGANTFFRYPFKLENEWLYGLVNSAPYLCCAFIGCWLTEPLNNYFGRRGAILITCVISSVTCLGQGLTQNWQQMFVARFLLGLGIGPKSATIPVYAAECTPAAIRGGLVMFWQMFTAFGIALGLVMGVAFLDVGDITNKVLCPPEAREALLSYHCSINWRLMIGSPMVIPLVVCVLVYFSPESPRWYMKKGRYQEAFKSLIRLRHSDIQAARDLFYIYVLLEAEKEVSQRRNRHLEVFTLPRNRRALQASLIVMILQQFCGVNVPVYYSSEILLDRGGCSNSSSVAPLDRGEDSNSSRVALLGSMGFGITNFLFALPAVWTIDTFGRRNLLLSTFPLMGIFMLFVGIVDKSKKAHLQIIGIALFTVVYSPGEGPVPFVYSAECYPLYIRDIGMSIATAVTWFFNFLLNFSWPWLHQRMCGGAFGLYAGFNFVGFFLILLFVPETKNRSLEELNAVFGVPSSVHARFGIRQAWWFLRKLFFRRGGESPVIAGLEGRVGRRQPVAGGGEAMTSSVRVFPDDASSVNVDRTA